MIISFLVSPWQEVPTLSVCSPLGLAYICTGVSPQIVYTVRLQLKFQPVSFTTSCKTGRETGIRDHPEIMDRNSYPKLHTRFLLPCPSVMIVVDSRLLVKNHINKIAIIKGLYFRFDLERIFFPIKIFYLILFFICIYKYILAFGVIFCIDFWLILLLIHININ